MENARDLRAVMDTISTRSVYYAVIASGEVHTSRHEVAAFYQEMFDAVPDLRVEVERITVDHARRRAVVEDRVSGTLVRSAWGLAPTHRFFEIRTAVFYAFDEQGKLTEEISYFDKNELLESMGIICNTKTELGRFWMIFLQSPIYALRCAAASLLAQRP